MIKKSFKKQKTEEWLKFKKIHLCPVCFLEIQYGFWGSEKWSFFKFNLNLQRQSFFKIPLKFGIQFYLELFGFYIIILFYIPRSKK